MATLFFLEVLFKFSFFSQVPFVHNEVACCWWLDKGLSRVFRGQTVFEFWVLRFRVLGASFSIFGCFVFDFWVLRFRDLGASCFGLRFRVLRFRNYWFFTLFPTTSVSFSSHITSNELLLSDGLNKLITQDFMLLYSIRKFIWQKWQTLLQFFFFFFAQLWGFTNNRFCFFWKKSAWNKGTSLAQRMSD